MSWLPPGILVGLLLILVLSGLFAAFWPSRHSRYPAVLLLTAAGVLAGQAWDALGLPALRLGEANVLPAVAFAAALQPLAERVSLRLP
jgi:ABC-type phosphate transport system auxiliary subunit